MDEIIHVAEIRKTDAIEALNRSEIDIQISTAKAYPREIGQSINKIIAVATRKQETAEACFYSLRRKGKNGADSVIEGPSVRLAEIVSACWGNLRTQSRIIANDGKFITAQGICHDLESNSAVSSEVQRRITDSKGRTFSEDMQVVTGNAAGAIAFRNAVFKTVPMALLGDAISEIRRVALGETNNLEIRRQNMLAYFRGVGVSEEMLLYYTSKDCVESIDAEALFQLRGAANAIKEGTSTVRELFIAPFEQSKAAEKAERKKSEASAMISKALHSQDEPADDFPAD